MKDQLVFQVGDRVWFQRFKKPYRVRASNSLFTICTQPFNLHHSVMYTIIDHEKQIRGTENLIFCMGFESDQDCIEALERLTKGETEVSGRNYVALDVIGHDKKYYSNSADQ